MPEVDIELRSKLIEDARLVAQKLGESDPKLKAVKYVVTGTVDAADKAQVFRDEIVEVRSSTTTKALEIRRCDTGKAVLMLYANGNLAAWDEQSKFMFGHVQALANQCRHGKGSPTPPRR